MSRIAKRPIAIPKGVECQIDGNQMNFKGKKGQLSSPLHANVLVDVQDGQIQVSLRPEVAAQDQAIVGTTVRLIQNSVHGVDVGFEKKLRLEGVGYRAAMKGDKLELRVGFSHPVEVAPPAGIKIEVPSQTEIVVKGIDKTIVGQVAANIREVKPPEPYKGKGIRYLGEKVATKEVKKK